MPRIETEMTGHRPRVTESDHRWGHHDLVIHTTSGTLALAILPMQGRELAKVLIEAFSSAEDVMAELNEELGRMAT